MRPPPASSLLGLPEPPLLSFPPSRLRRSPPLAPLSTGATPGAGRPGRPLFPYGRATFPGLQLLLGPGTSGVDVTFILSVLDAKASRTRSTRGAPSARPSPPCARPSHPARLTHGSRTFPPPCTAHASLARRACTSPLYPLVPFCAQVLDAASLPMPPRPRCRHAPDAASPPMQGLGSNVRSPNPELREVLDKREGGVRKI